MEGALLFNLVRSVTSRISKYTYGINSSPSYDSNNSDHVARRHTCFTGNDGTFCVPGRFGVILEKVVFNFFRFLFTGLIRRIPRFLKRKNSERLSIRTIHRRNSL